MALKFIRRKFKEIDPDEILVDSVSALEMGEGVRLEQPIARMGAILFLILAGVAIGGGFFRVWRLAVVSGENFLQQSRENRFFSRPVMPPRGVIFDSENNVLAENIPSFRIILDRNEFLRSGEDFPSLLGRLAQILEVPPESLFDSGFSDSSDPSLLPPRVFIGGNLSPEKIIPKTLLLEELPGIELAEGYRRSYHDPGADSHVLGFVGKISSEEIEARPKLRMESLVGKSGLEAYYDEDLRGKGGKKIFEVDAAGRETNFKFAEEPEPGSDLILMLDGKLQSFAYDTLASQTQGKKGASVVIMDPRNGGIRALASFPGFDSNRLGYSLSQKEFSDLLSDPLKPFFNRVVAGEFPSGSTIKPIIAAAALNEKLIDPNKKIYDPGFIEIPNPYVPGAKSVFVDWRPQGWVNFYDAIAVSANVYFYMIGGGFEDQPGLGIERIKKYAELFGFGQRLGIDLPGEKTGEIPDPEWKKLHEPEDPVWRIGDTYNVSIGQGGVRVTPLQLVTAISAIANGGTVFEPHILWKKMDNEGNLREEITPKVIRGDIIPDDVLREVRRGMRQTVTAGVARLLQEVPVAVSAKTGTAQSGDGKLPHAWVTAYAPADNPEIAITVMVEHAGEGSTVAVPITNEILKWYFMQKNSKP